MEINKRLKVTGVKILRSIAFWPALIAVLFLLLCFLMIWFDFSPLGKSLKQRLHWLSLKDATTARSILSTITAGVISLTVFSFSMVMIVLNQAAGKLSNRILDKLIENRFQQVVLGCYIGTIVYALFLLSTIRDVNTGVYVPALSTYVVIALTVLDIFLFLYFLHHITQSVKFETVIKRIQKETYKSITKHSGISDEENAWAASLKGAEILAPESGTYDGFDTKALLKIAEDENLTISLLVKPGDFLLRKTPLLSVNKDEELTIELLYKILSTIYISKEELIEHNYLYGFRQLTEIAVRALSPGINDPGTAVESLKALVELLAFRIENYPATHIVGEAGTLRIITQMHTFDELFNICIQPVWDYGKNDRLLQIGIKNSLAELTRYSESTCVTSLIEAIKFDMAKMEL